MKTIPAHSGWSIVSNPKSKIYREPVIAWILHPTGETARVMVFPITVRGTLTARDVIFERPDGTFVQPGSNMRWDSELELMAYFEEEER